MARRLTGPARFWFAVGMSSPVAAFFVFLALANAWSGASADAKVWLVLLLPVIGGVPFATWFAAAVPTALAVSLPGRGAKLVGAAGALVIPAFVWSSLIPGQESAEGEAWRAHYWSIVLLTWLLGFISAAILSLRDAAPVGPEPPESTGR